MPIQREPIDELIDALAWMRRQDREEMPPDQRPAKRLRRGRKRVTVATSLAIFLSKTARLPS